MKTVRKYICIMMSALIVLMLPAAVSAFAAETSSKDFVVENGILVDYKGENNLLEVVSIPSNLGITAIGENAFSDTVIRTVIIPKGVTTIKKYAFADCASLKSVSLPDTLTTIEDYSFSGCDNLTEIYLPDSVKNFGECIFEKKTRQRILLSGAEELPLLRNMLLDICIIM